MKKVFILMTMLLVLMFNTNYALAAKSDKNSVETVENSEQSAEISNAATKNAGPSIWEKILDVIIGILSVSAVLAIIAHMIYVKYLQYPRYKHTYDEEFFRNKRLEEQKPEYSTNDEDIMCEQYLMTYGDDWKTYIDKETGEEDSYPTKRKQMNNAIEMIENVIAISPTSPEIIERINIVTDSINELEKRHFNGSKTLMWIAGVIGVIPIFFGAWQICIVMLMGMALYYIASQRPVFLLLKQQDSKPGFVDAIIIWALGMIGAAQTVTTVTKWSDGSTTKEDDNSQHWFAWIFALVIILLLAMYMSVLSFFSYLRNYVFYF